MPTAGAAVRVEVFSDPQCGTCRQFYLENLEPLLDDFGDTGEVCVVHYLFPLRTHAHAREASLYALAGGALGAGGRERVLDALFRSQDRWADDGDLRSALATAFSTAELDLLAERAATPELAAQLEGEVAVARGRRVSSTPTVFVVHGEERQSIPATVQYPLLRRYLAHLVEP